MPGMTFCCSLLQIVAFFVLFLNCSISRTESTNSEIVIDAKTKRLMEYEEWKSDHLSWLSQSQTSKLDSIFEDGASNEDLFLKIFDFFDFEESKRDPSSQIAVEKLSKGCVRFMKENLELKSSEFFDALEEMYESPFEEEMQNQLITKANQLYSQIEGISLKIFAKKFLPSCVKIFILEAVSKTKPNTTKYTEQDAVSAKHVKGFLENCNKWTVLYLSWLSEDQKNELNVLIKDKAVTVDDIHIAVMQIYARTVGETLVKANHDLVQACDAFVNYLDPTPELSHLEQFHAIRKRAADPHTVAEGKVFGEKIGQRLKTEVSQLIASVTGSLKHILASKFLPTCHGIYLFNCRLIRTYHDNQNRKNYILQDDVINKWTKLYLNWLTPEQKLELNIMIEEGASIEELRTAVENFYSAADGVQFIRATESLNDGCAVLMKYLAGEENLNNFLVFMEDIVERYSSKDDQLDDQYLEDSAADSDSPQSNELKKAMAEGAFELILSKMNDAPKQNLAQKFIVTCSYVFESTVRIRLNSEQYTGSYEEN